MSRTPFYANSEGRYVPNHFYYQPRVYQEGYKINEFGPTKFLPKKDALLDIMPPQCPLSHI